MNRGGFIDRQRKGVAGREDGIFFFLAHASVFEKNEKKNKTTSVYRLQYRNYTEITVVMRSQKPYPVWFPYRRQRYPV